MTKRKQKVRIFVASSRHAKPLAQKLANGLRNYSADNYELEPILWWKSESTLTAILDDLIEQTRRCDFAIILLTSKVTGLPKNAEERERRKMRYNAIYEAGLFAGALGPDKNRCFFVASGGLDQLPTDLMGLKWEFFEENTDGSDRDEKLKNIAENIGEIIAAYPRDKIRPLRGLKKPILDKDELAQREAHKSDMGNLVQNGALVFVNTPSPIEMEDPEFANRVLDNIFDHQIKYRYVFEENAANITAIGMVLANVIDSACERQPQLPRESIFDKLAAGLSIYFVQENPGLEYCVHNADLPSAVCYLRFYKSDKTPRWVQWYDGLQARAVATEIERIRDRDMDVKVNHIFHNTHYAHPYEKVEHKNDGTVSLEIALTPLGDQLWEGIVGALTNDITNDEKAIQKMCFGEVSQQGE